MSKKQYYDMFDLGPDPIPAPMAKCDEVPKQHKKAVARNERTISVQTEVIAKPERKAYRYEEADLNDTVHTILQCLSNISAHRYYGITILVDVLRGANSQRIREAQLDQIPEYGALKHVGREVLTTIIEWLIEQNFILKTKGMYPVLHPTYNSMHYAETMTNAKLNKLRIHLMEQHQSAEN